MQPTLSYRPDIDGLRATAVLGVLFYHYGATWLPGGFTGVDVFFVISGYLITSILFREIEAGEFSLLRFYDRRIRRILPALIAVLAATMSAGWLLLMPGDYADLGKSAVYAMFGLGNLFFFWNTGYFDRVADLQPLLHTWSLGVEEQFYLFWPALLYLSFRLLKLRVAIAFAIGALLAIDLISAAIHVGVDPKAAFYLTHFRAWELGVGALLALLPALSSRLLAEIIRAVGLALIACSYFFVTDKEPFPGINAAYACAGAALLIWPSSPTTLISRFLSIRPAVTIGLISYSLYLWHWPLLVLFRHWNNSSAPNAIEAAILAATSVTLAVVTFRLIERPAREVKWIRCAPTSVVVLAAGALIAAAPAFTILKTEGWPQRIDPKAADVAGLDTMWKWECPQHIEIHGKRYCAMGAPWDTAKVHGILWGESNAEHIAPLVATALDGSEASVFLLRGCAPIFGGKVHRINEHDPTEHARCIETRAKALEIIYSYNIDFIVMAAVWPLSNNVMDLYWEDDKENRSTETGYFLAEQALRDLVLGFHSSGKKTTIVGTFPRPPQHLLDCAYSRYSGLPRRQCSTLMPFSQYQALSGRTIEILADVAATIPSVHLVRPAEGLCNKSECKISLDGEVLFRDPAHLRRNLPERIRKELADAIGLTSALRSVTSHFASPPFSGNRRSSLRGAPAADH